jgi:hypothetical protein
MTESNSERASLSASGAIASISIVAAIDHADVAFDVTYRFEESGEFDCKPLLVNLVHSPLRFVAVSTSDGCAIEFDDEHGLGLSGTRALFLHGNDGWADAEFSARMVWPAQSGAAAGNFLQLRRHLPDIATGRDPASARSACPRMTLVGDAGIDDIVCGGIALEPQWRVGAAPLQVEEAVFARPGSSTSGAATQEWNVGSRQLLTFTPDVLVTSTVAERESFSKYVAISQKLLEAIFGEPVWVRIVAVHETLGRDDSAMAPAFIARFSRLDQGDEGKSYKEKFLELWIVQSRAWWGTGVCLLGEHADLAISAIGIAAAFRISQAQSTERALNLEGPLASPRADLRLGAHLFLALRDGKGTANALRELTEQWWGQAVPAREFFAWCQQRDIELPPEFVAP